MPMDDMLDSIKRTRVCGMKACSYDQHQGNFILFEVKNIGQFKHNKFSAAGQSVWKKAF